MSLMLGVIYAECHKQAHYAECLYAECRYAECLGASPKTRLAANLLASTPLI